MEGAESFKVACWSRFQCWACEARLEAGEGNNGTNEWEGGRILLSLVPVITVLTLVDGIYHVTRPLARSYVVFNDAEVCCGRDVC